VNIKISGGQKLSGVINPSGSKNSVVAVLPSTILLKSPVTLRNVPDITDVTKLVNILQKLGSDIKWDKNTRVMIVDNSHLSFEKVSREDWNEMRGTSLLWGPMLARFGKVDFRGLPGGCTLGFRTLLPHYKAFEDMGVKVKESLDGIVMDAKSAKAGDIWLREMSPTATENAIMFALSLKGTTKIMGAASEPQVQDLCTFLNRAGAKITGVGSSIVYVEGGHELDGIEYTLFSDHYEIATFLALGAITGGRIEVLNSQPELFDHINYIFSRFGIDISYKGNTAIVAAGQKIRIVPEGEGRSFLTVKAQPWPSLPVDLLPMFIPISLKAESGVTLYHNWMYDAGLFWTSELVKLGANIIMCDPHRIITVAGSKLRGSVLEAPYIIRAVVAMVMACMVAEGESTILNADALYRGHPDFAENLQRLGAKIAEV
jgi:UDP-N-acetylglucosamine 1-carboxyvinyltransferase